jgi:serine/threonine protein kinase
MAVAFRARDERLDRVVALKILAPALAADEAFRQRFIRESRAAAAVDDPHIIPVYEAGDADGVLYIAMRYARGGDLRTIVRRDGPMLPARVAVIIWQVASALDAAHAAGLIHRDVKPANMLVDVRPGQADHVYLADFGLSKSTLSTSGLTETGQFLGTMDYISPEQIQGQQTDGRTDQYALACAAYELLTGQPPFRRDEAMAVMYAQLSEPPPPVTARRRDLPPAIDQVFARALAKQAVHRFPSCREFAQALLQVLGMAPYRPNPQVAPVPPRPGRQPAGRQPAGRQPAWNAPSPPRRGVVTPRPMSAGTPGTRPMGARPGGPGPVGARPVGAGPAGARPTGQQPGYWGGRAVPAPPVYGPGRLPAGPRRPWTRDWTAWLLIISIPVTIFALSVASLGAAGAGLGGALFLVVLVAVPTALIAKLVRRMRRPL